LTRYAVSGVVSGKEEAYLVEENTSRIWLRNKNLTHFDFQSLESLQTIKEVYLDFNKIEEVNLEPLSSHNSLQILSLSGNKIETIDLKPLRNSCTSLM